MKIILEHIIPHEFSNHYYLDIDKMKKYKDVLKVSLAFIRRSMLKGGRPNHNHSDKIIRELDFMSEKKIDIDFELPAYVDAWVKLNE